MTEHEREADLAIASFMGRVAEACGRSEAPPNATLVWIKAELERRAEREKRAERAELWGFGIKSLALVVTALLVVRLSLPVVTALGDAALVTGILLAGTALVVWFFGLRFLQSAR